MPMVEMIVVRKFHSPKKALDWAGRNGCMVMLLRNGMTGAYRILEEKKTCEVCGEKAKRYRNGWTLCGPCRKAQIQEAKVNA